MKIEDLDILRPEPRFIHIGGKDIDVSFIPCGITFDVDNIVQELQEIDQVKLSGDPEHNIKPDKDTIKKAFDLSIDLCVAFCSWKYPELDKEWFLSETSPNQIQAFSTAIKDALVRAYAGVESDPKNHQAPRKKK